MSMVMLSGASKINDRLINLYIKTFAKIKSLLLTLKVNCTEPTEFNPAAC